MSYKLWTTNEVLTAADLNAYLMRQSVIKCTSGTRPASPDEGMMIWETDTDQLKVYNGTGWVRTGAFDTETAGHGYDNDSTTISSITSTTPAAGSPACGFSFVAPPSGGVYVTVSGRINQSSNGNETLLGYQVRSGGTVGTGTIQVDYSSFRAIATGRAVVTSGSSMASASRRHRINPGDLTAGSTFNVQTMHWVTGGTGSVDYREVIVEPVL
jgi:hypothetical protein